MQRARLHTDEHVLRVAHQHQRHPPTDPTRVTEQFVPPLVSAFPPDWRWEVRHELVEGDLVALHFSVAGTHFGDFRGIAATGRRVVTSEFTLYRVEGDKFTHVWDITDMDAVLEQITATETQ